jgi:hypothetical protein
MENDAQIVKEQTAIAAMNAMTQSFI